MFRFLRVLSHRSSILIVLVCMLVVGVSLSSGVTRAQETFSPPACAVTPALLGGQGFRVSGQGFRVSGQGFRVSGQGFRVSGQGFRVSGQGVNLDPVAVANEIVDNPVTPGKWVNDRLDFFDERVGFNTDKTAIIIVDEFQQTDPEEEPHGLIVKQVIDDSVAAITASHPDLQITTSTVDISDDATNYNGDIIATKISAEVARLQGEGYRHFVLNMSFGLISCSDPGPIINGVQFPPFNFTQATQVIAANNQPTPSLALTPILNCVVKVTSYDDDHHYGDRSRVTDKRDGSGGSTSSYIAYFGYKNANGQLQTIPVGANNMFSPSPNNRSQPTQFEPGQQNFVFSVKFDGSNLTWTLKGPDGQTRSVTASKYSTPCSPVPPTPSQPVTPVVECVADEGNNMFEARFGYINPNTVGVTIPVGYKNTFTPAPADRGQLTTFAPGTHNGVFKVYFDGSDLKWTLGSITVTANSSTQGCAEQEDFGLDQYIIQTLGVPEDLLPVYFSYLANKVTNDESQALRILIRQYLSDSADTAKNFTGVTVASSGNLRPWLGDAPLAPASWREAIAVGATLDDGTNIWQFSQDANAVAPGVGYPIGTNSFAAGTSFAAPAFSVLVGMCSTVPSALKFDGTNPPLTLDSSGNKIYDNSVIGTSDLTPLLCKPNRNPTVSPIGDRNNKEEDTVSIQVVASDPDGDTLQYAATGLPSGLKIDANTGVISGTIDPLSANTYTVTVTVTDNGTPQGSASTTFSWVVISNKLPVTIDIRPHSTRNRINLKSHGMVGVVVFSSATFDATKIDTATVTLAGAPVAVKSKGFYTKSYDVNGDGRTDVVFWFEIQKLQLTTTSTQAVLLGNTILGTAFRGVDSVSIVPQRPLHLLTPTSGATVSTSSVTLTWIDDEDWDVGDNDCFTVQIATGSGFSNSSMVQGAIVVDNESFVTKQLKNGTYYWRAAFSDCSSGILGSWSDVSSFKVQK